MVLAKLLDNLVYTIESRGFSIKDYLYPGLSRQEISELLQGIPVSFPESFYQLYQWRNGHNIQCQHFLFAEYQFLPLQDAISEYTEISKYYNSSIHKVSIRHCFPIATFQGDSIAIYCRDEFFYGLSYPIINIGEGIAIVYENLELFIRTMTEWYGSGIYDSDSVDDQRRWAIQHTLNPHVPKLTTSF